MQHVMKFLKVHALGNDFMIIDRLTQSFFIDAPLVRSLANRKTGIGFDQLLILEPPVDVNYDFTYQVYYANGVIASSPCWNGMRALTHYIHDYNLLKKKELLIQSHQHSFVSELISHSVTKVSHPSNLNDITHLEALQFDQWQADSVIVCGEKHILFWDCSKDAKKSLLARSKEEFLKTYAVMSFVSLDSDKNILLESIDVNIGRVFNHGAAAIAAAIAYQKKQQSSRENIRVITQTGYVTVNINHKDIALLGPITRAFKGECLVYCN
ncbi:MAG: hypothetical protein FJ161_00680 [Gammaproteobacteria bacterium]|nr:hypothetical protein [Gammaproteobacteria bacterium]